jgi:hypothetical protein
MAVQSCVMKRMKAVQKHGEPDEYQRVARRGGSKWPESPTDQHGLLHGQLVRRVSEAVDERAAHLEGFLLLHVEDVVASWAPGSL